MDRSGWKSRYRWRWEFRSRKNLDLGREWSVGDLSTFLGDAEAKKSPLAKGELTNGRDLSDASGEGAFFIGRGKRVLRALSNCIPERQRARRRGGRRISRSKHCRRLSRAVEILIDDFHKCTNSVVGKVGKGGGEDMVEEVVLGQESWKKTR